MSANNTDVLVSNETNTTSSNNELNKTSTDSKTNSTNSQAEKRPHDNSGSYFNCFFFITNGLTSFPKKHS